MAATAVVVAGVTVVGASMVPSDASGPATSDDAATAATAVPPSTAPAPSELPAPLPPLPDGGLARGSAGAAVEALERRLGELRYDPGPVDGSFDGPTESAVMAFEKVNGLEPTGHVDPLVWAALENAGDPEPLLPAGGARRIEIDLERQLLFAYDDGRLALVTHVSTGSGVPYCEGGVCGSAVTPAGAHRFLWRVSGWRTSRLGRLYNPVYFTSYGIAVHGARSVPTHPASHGCVRIPMHIAEYFPTLVERGDPVYVLDGETEVQPISRAEPLPEPRLDGDPPPTTTTTTLSGTLS